MLADSGVAVILLTASELDERIFATLRAGARGPVLKDTEPAELVRAIELLARGDALLSPTLTRRLIAELAAIPDPQLPSSDLLDELTPANARSSRCRARPQQPRHRRAARHQPRHIQDPRQPGDAQARRPRPRPTRRVRLPRRARRPPPPRGGARRPGAGARVITTSASIAHQLRRQSIVPVESTTPPETTSEQWRSRRRVPCHHLHDTTTRYDCVARVLSSCSCAPCAAPRGWSRRALRAVVHPPRRRPARPRAPRRRMRRAGLDRSTLMVAGVATLAYCGRCNAESAVARTR